MKIPLTNIVIESGWIDTREVILTGNNKINHYISRENVIQVHLENINDFGKISKILDQRSEEYFTFKTKDEKSLRAVMKGVSSFMEIACIQKLVERGFENSSTARMYREQNGEKLYITLVLVQLPKTAFSKEIHRGQKLDKYKSPMLPMSVLRI